MHCPVEALQGSSDFLARIFFDDFLELLLAVVQMEADFLLLHLLSQEPLREILEKERDIP